MDARVNGQFYSLAVVIQKCLTAKYHNRPIRNKQSKARNGFVTVYFLNTVKNVNYRKTANLQETLGKYVILQGFFWFIIYFFIYFLQIFLHCKLYAIAIICLNVFFMFVCLSVYFHKKGNGTQPVCVG